MFSIVAEMNQHILYEHGEYLVRNPCASEENFAEKWNRADGEGESYKGAFYLWHAEALTDIALGLTNWGSQDAFVREVRKNSAYPQALLKILQKSSTGHGRSPGASPGKH